MSLWGLIIYIVILVILALVFPILWGLYFWVAIFNIIRRYYA